MPKTFREKVREERERLGFSLEQLGAKIGSTKGYMWELENKASVRPSAEKVFALAKAFGCSPDYLMDETGKIKRDVEQQDRAFFSKYQTLTPEHKKIIQGILDQLDND